MTIDRIDPPVDLPACSALVQPLVEPDRAAVLREASRAWPSWDLTPRQLCDLELILNGGFSPLCGFMTRDDVEAVCQSMRLASGILWPVPVTLDVPEALASQLGAGGRLALRDQEGVMLAVLHVQEVWQPDRRAEADALFGTISSSHPGVDTLLNRTHPWYVGGMLEGTQLPVHHDFTALRLTPAAARAEFRTLGWTQIAAVARRMLMDRATVEGMLRTVQDLDAGLFVHVTAGPTLPGDVQHYTNIRCLNAAVAKCPRGSARLAVSPLVRRSAGPRDSLLDAITEKNFGCTHLILADEESGDRSPAGDVRGNDRARAEELLRANEEELGIAIVAMRRVAYDAHRGAYLAVEDLDATSRVLRLPDAELRARLDRGEEIPDWFMFREVADELRRTHRPRHEQGFTVFFTGLSGAGKSTLANALLTKLLEEGSRPVTLLDGDRVRKHLSSELGFSKEHRMLNVRRVGYVASEVTRSGGIAICALIAPHDAIRREVRRMIEPLGGFVLVHVSTSLEVCEERDRKGLYAKARAGLIPEFTGISDAYEPAPDADLTIDTATQSAAMAAETIVAYLRSAGFLKAPAQQDAPSAASTSTPPRTQVRS